MRACHFLSLPFPEPAVFLFWKGIQIAAEKQWTPIQTTEPTKKKMMTTTPTTASHSSTQSVEMMMMMDTCTAPPPSSMGVEDMMMSNTTTARLLDGALGDMVAVSTPRSAADGAEEGAWQTVRRMASSYTQEDLNLWWSVDAGYLLMDEEKKKAAAVVGVVSVEEGDNDNCGNSVPATFSTQPESSISPDLDSQIEAWASAEPFTAPQPALMTSALREMLEFANQEYSNTCGGTLDGGTLGFRVR
jgi:hypothetical protein